MIVVDSSVWIGVLANAANPQTHLFFSIGDRTQILVGDVILLEVLRGAASERIASRIEQELRRFDMAAMMNSAIAIKAARNYRTLRSRGVTIRNSIDLIIGTYCIENGHRLLQRDRDFAHMQPLGLQLYAG